MGHATMNKETVIDALRIVQEGLPWEVQVFRHGFWETVEDTEGRTKAHERLNALKSDTEKWRAVTKNEAVSYREGVNDGRNSRSKKSPKRRHPQTYVPDGGY